MSALGAVDESIVQNCGIDPPPSNWPNVQVVALFPFYRPDETPAMKRTAARSLARHALLQQLGATAVASLLELPRAARGAQCVSFSHEAGVSLVAWSTAGAVGVDLVDLDSLLQVSQEELVVMAALYLGPAAAAEVATTTLADAGRLVFALHWCRLEAKLKCLGLELDEWQLSLKRLAPIATVRVHVLATDGLVSKRWIGCLAWR